MTTIDLIDVFCRQSIIGIDPIDVFLTIGAQLWLWVSRQRAVEGRGRYTDGSVRINQNGCSGN
jgi:hypothetical protein